MSIFLLLLLTSSEVFSQLGSDLIIDSTIGKIRGVDQDYAYGFLGIPFAQPPVGDLRLREPQPVIPWEDIFEANEKSPGVCRSVTNHQTAAHSRYKHISVYSKVDEDCLYLNLWVPKTGRTDYPTMIFMHGGRFRDGSGSALLYDGRILAQDADAIIITINYRTEAFGWLFLGDVHDPATGKKESIANHGLRDQKMAFKWTKDNIALVGGDPNKITISGQSAGAQSVGVHLVSEESRDLFDQALMFSNPYSLPFKLLDDGVALGKGVANLIGCPDVFDLDCWRAVSAEDLLAASRQATSAIYNPNEILQIFEPWSPAVGPYTELPEEVMIVNQQGAAQKKPTMLGTVREEGWPYITGIFRNELGNLQYRLFLKAIIPPYYRELINLYPADNTRDADQRNILSDTCTDFIFYCPSINISLSMSDQGYDNFYFYVLNSAWSFEEEWTEKYKDCWGHVCHGGDLPYIFRSGPLATYLTPPVKRK
ncbi:putative cAMP-regulated D2 protein-like [Apostichopus japonicus]|uniref:Putative cAMP-regulated D2 protein-like n=1 Tax=Stichopus japonicus TaxID=307972 RepID=A0A2G8JLL0_STIJA|nr:putative cAMP-regulated D2 protein-like [Apostichopus japonicus]